MEEKGESQQQQQQQQQQAWGTPGGTPRRIAGEAGEKVSAEELDAALNKQRPSSAPVPNVADPAQARGRLLLSSSSSSCSCSSSSFSSSFSSACCSPHVCPARVPHVCGGRLSHSLQSTL